MLTELQAVNEMLETINESPVTSLTPPISEEAALALKTLRKVSGDVQMRGWWFNMDVKQTLTPDVDGKITLSDDTIKLLVDPHTAAYDAPILRGTHVYWGVNATYVWTKPLTNCTLVRVLAWDYLPQEARVYIQYRAARLLSKKTNNSEMTVREAGAEELRAYDELMRAELQQSRPNALMASGIVEVAFR